MGQCPEEATMSERNIEGLPGDHPADRASEESVTPGAPSFEGEHGERVEGGRMASVEEDPGEAGPS
jgi:hypothetical protein